MKKIQLINDDYWGHVNHLRHASRGIVVNDGKVLLSYETINNKYMIPGGGVEEGESYAECCERELLEETGMRVKAVEEYLEIEELFEDWRHISHYFVCELIEDTGVQHLTEGEKAAGMPACGYLLKKRLKTSVTSRDFIRTLLKITAFTDGNIMHLWYTRT